MPLKYPLVHELVIVIADLYLPEDRTLEAEGLCGIERVARFGRRIVIQQGWRAWLARATGSADLACQPVAQIAALAAQNVHASGCIWMATPLHLVAGLTSVHLEQRGLLRLPLSVARELAQDFRHVFHGSGYTLEPVTGGGFLMAGPLLRETRTLEPARCVGMDIRAVLPAAPELRRLGAELELWLHEHPVNLARMGRGELPISTLWLWGGAAPPRPSDAPRAASADDTQRFCGSDPYLAGLAFARGVAATGLPARLEDLLHTPAGRLVIVVELAEILEAERTLGAAAALGAIDARWIHPAARLVGRGAARCLRVLANDRCLSFRRHDRLRLWRQPCRGLAGLA